MSISKCLVHMNSVECILALFPSNCQSLFVPINCLFLLQGLKSPGKRNWQERKAISA